MSKFTGYINITKNNQAIVWKIPFDRSAESINISNELIRKYDLKSGAHLECEIKNNQIVNIIKICNMTPEDYKIRNSFNNLIPQNPDERFEFGNSNNSSLRIIDLLTPIGKGTRGLIVSPPRAGKTVLLENLANEFHKNNPELQVVVLLIDERPEEVTSFKMNTKAEVFHSSMDKGSWSHQVLGNFMLNHIRTELECGNDIVVLIDSLTRLGRAHNLNDNRHRNRIMSGGIAAGALELPRKLFGLARNIQNGGSCTILATILTNTGSRMDEVIFQEFKGTGNCEIILDRELADMRIFPAINIAESGTRKEELLRSNTELDKINTLRRKLLQMDKLKTVPNLLQLVSQHASNSELIKQLTL